MGKNTVRKLTPFVDTDIFAAESWLSDMAAKGLFFNDSSMWQHVIFEKGEPAKRKYRLVPAGFVEISMISEEEKEIQLSRLALRRSISAVRQPRLLYGRCERGGNIYRQ